MNKLAPNCLSKQHINLIPAKSKTSGIARSTTEGKGVHLGSCNIETNWYIDIKKYIRLYQLHQIMQMRKHNLSSWLYTHVDSKRGT